MTKPLYAHRIQAILQHSVAELGLVVTLSDSEAEVSLAANEEMIRAVAAAMSLHCERIERHGFCTLVVSRERLDLRS